MEQTQEERLEAAKARQALLNVSIAQVEKEWKELRAQSRQNTLDLITQLGVSVAATSRITGHTRATITTWLQVHNAEMKSAQRPADVAGAQGEE
jgi:DNA invertase Pin-like site-specific DNA recombinase